MTPPTERERKWLEQVLRIHGFTKDSSPMDIRKGVLAVAAEVLTKTKEACAVVAECNPPMGNDPNRKECPACQAADRIRNLEITGE